MKDKKMLLLLLPILIFVITFAGVYYINKSYAYNIFSDQAELQTIKNGTKYKMLRKNTYSWHLITNNFTQFTSQNASGTKLIRTVDKVNDKYAYAVVFCATEGKTLSSTENRKRYSIDSSKVSALSTAKKTKLKAVMPYMYPYVTLGTLKTTLQDATLGIGDSYSKYSFGSLTAQEAITASQAAIWNIQKGYTTELHYSYRGTISSFSDFDACKEFYNDKVVTSEEESWYQQSGCDKSGNFYKYVFNHTKDSNTKNRINTLIKWYINSLQSKLPTPTTDTFSVQSSSFESNDLTINVDTNMTAFDIEFTDENGTVLTATNPSSNVYKISNVPTTVNQVNIAVASKNAGNHIFYYIGSNGQDFVGLEKTYYTNSEQVNIERTTEKGKIILYKVGDTSKNVEVSENSTGNYDESICRSSSTGNCLNNAKFELYYQNKNNLYREIETDYSNSATYIIENLPLGTYYLRETQPAYGYSLYNYGVGDVDSQGYIKIEITGTKTFDVLVNNTENKVCFAKVDGATGASVAKARFLIYDIDGAILEDFKSSANEGQESYCRTGLQSGSYFIQEIEAPEGYTVDPTLYHFTVGNGDSDISSLEDLGDYKEAPVSSGVITFTNSKQVSISKSDATTGACVEGAKLIVRDSNGEIVKDSSGNVIGEWISKCGSETSSTTDTSKICVTGNTGYTGSAEIGSDTAGDDNESEYICTGTPNVNKAKDSYRLTLEPGTYTLTEVMTDELKAQGYSSKPDTISFTVNADGSVTGSTDMKDDPIKVCLYKTNKDKTKKLAGAKFKIYKEDGKTLVNTFTTSENEKCLTYLPIGNYIIKEIEAPNGYQVTNEEIKLNVVDTNEKQYFYVVNEVVAPKTDFDKTKTLMIVSTLFMVFGIGMVGYYGFKKKH